MGTAIGCWLAEGSAGGGAVWVLSDALEADDFSVLLPGRSAIAAAVLLASAGLTGVFPAVPLGALLGAVALGSIVGVAFWADFLAKAPSASKVSALSEAPFDGDDEAAPLGFCGAWPSEGGVDELGAVSGVKAWAARPSGGRAMGFGLGGDASAGEIEGGAASLGSSSNAAKGLV
jgi:hypothetical protein